jgi:hypothetical protein
LGWSEWILHGARTAGIAEEDEHVFSDLEPFTYDVKMAIVERLHAANEDRKLIFL